MRAQPQANLDDAIRVAKEEAGPAIRYLFRQQLAEADLTCLSKIDREPQDRRFDYPETRMITAGHLRGRLVIIVWTQRGDVRHIISMRYCHEKEEKRWRVHLD